ncbi:MAG: hypothetical protein IJL74_00460 [Bacilli bacterium]|nr:hypothetical protein [Bacilli bacterium]
MKRIFYISSLVLGIVLIVGILYAFSLLQSDTTRVVQNGLGQWTILVNEVDVTSEAVDFDIDTINYDSDVNVKTGRLAPGLGGYFDIAIDPSGTEVSVRYDITFDYSNLEDSETSIAVSSVRETSGKRIIQTGPSTYTGIITLDEIELDQVDTIRTTISWPNVEANNDKDYELGKTENATIEIPVNVLLTQYNGEQVVQYEGE